jgi:Fungal specific transcription factor domain
MWMLAASMGSQFQHMQPALYAYTRSRLDCWDLDILSDSIPIEQVQAWILLAVYEIMQVNCQRGWISAGRCFRLVHLMKLHDIDNPKASHADLTWVEMEERRRTFWNAYCLDRHENLINQLPLTLIEQGV